MKVKNTIARHYPRKILCIVLIISIILPFGCNNSNTIEFNDRNSISDDYLFSRGFTFTDEQDKRNIYMAMMYTPEIGAEINKKITTGLISEIYGEDLQKKVNKVLSFPGYNNDGNTNWWDTFVAYKGLSGIDNFSYRDFIQELNNTLSSEDYLNNVINQLNNLQSQATTTSSNTRFLGTLSAVVGIISAVASIGSQAYGLYKHGHLQDQLADIEKNILHELDENRDLLINTFNTTNQQINVLVSNDIQTAFLDVKDLRDHLNFNLLVHYHAYKEAATTDMLQDVLYKFIETGESSVSGGYPKYLEDYFTKSSEYIRQVINYNKSATGKEAYDNFPLISSKYSYSFYNDFEVTETYNYTFPPFEEIFSYTNDSNVTSNININDINFMHYASATMLALHTELVNDSSTFIPPLTFDQSLSLRKSYANHTLQNQVKKIKQSINNALTILADRIHSQFQDETNNLLVRRYDDCMSEYNDPSICGQYASNLFKQIKNGVDNNANGYYPYKTYTELINKIPHAPLAPYTSHSSFPSYCEALYKEIIFERYKDYLLDAYAAVIAWEAVLEAHMMAYNKHTTTSPEVNVKFSNSLVSANDSYYFSAPETKTVRIENNGDSDLVINNISIANNEAFTMSGHSSIIGATIVPGSYLEFQLTFSPPMDLGTSDTPYTGTLVIDTNEADYYTYTGTSVINPEKAYTINLSGRRCRPLPCVPNSCLPEGHCLHMCEGD